ISVRRGSGVSGGEATIGAERSTSGIARELDRLRRKGLARRASASSAVVAGSPRTASMLQPSDRVGEVAVRVERAHRELTRALLRRRAGTGRKRVAVAVV